MQGNGVSIFDVEFDFWNLDFNVSPGALFQVPRIQYFVIDKEHSFAQHLFEQK
jgi:hypothetical protein